MTFSLCVHEAYVDDEGRDQHRFGVAVTTRLPGVGKLCPHVSERGAIATQSVVNVDLGERGIEYLGDGVAVDDALGALLNADDARAQRQVHGVDRDGTFAFSGEACGDWFGHYEGGDYTVAGNLLGGEDVIAATAAAYEAGRGTDALLAERLVDALEAGHEVGGDKRADLAVQSAALRVVTTEDRDPVPYYDDLRVDASKTPIADLRETFRLARQGYEDVLGKYREE